MITVAALQCRKCKSVIFSRARHDFRWCTCKAIGIDGGFDYIRCIGNEKLMKSVNLSLPLDQAILYNDWNRRLDKWGLHDYESIKDYMKEVKRGKGKVSKKKVSKAK